MVDDIVRIIVEVVDRFSDEIREMEGKMAKATRSRDSPVNLQLRGYQRARARLAALSRPAVKPILVKLVGDPRATGSKQATAMFRDAFTNLFGDPDHPRFESPYKQIKRGITSIIPTYHKWIALIALLLPMLIALAVAAAGVATAFLAVAGAGAVMLGLGLVGEGENMATAFENARRKLREFASELFNVAQPLAKLFAPFTERFLEIAPSQLTPLVRAAESLTVFQDTFESVFRGVIEWSAEAIQATAEYKDEFDELLAVFGPITGRGIIDFFRFVVEEAYENQDVLIALGGAFKAILRTVYEFSLFLGHVVSVFTPFIEAIEYLAELFQNKFVVTLTAGVLTFGIMLALMWRIWTVTHAMIKGFALLRAMILATQAAGGGWAGLQAALQAVNVQLTIAQLKAASLMATLTLGLSLLAGYAAYVQTEKMMAEMDARVSTTGYSRAPYGNSYAPQVASGSSVTYNINIDRMEKGGEHDLVSELESFESKQNHRNTPDPA